MNYQQCLKKLYAIGKERVPKNGLETIKDLLSHFDHPEKKCQFIHIAGSNGKGTAAFQIAESLHLAGHRVGLFTSPHIFCFRERIRIGSELISEEKVTALLSRIFEANLPASFFDIVTCAAFLYFVEQNVDIAIVEVGIGGKADATNVVHPLISVITSISLEHTEILGDTIEKIAFEKAGIIKEKTPVIIGPSVPRTVIDKVAESLNAQVTVCEQNIAKCALDLLGWSYDPNGLFHRSFCRFEKVGRYILDVAHNPDACHHLITMVKKHYPSRKIHCLFSFSKPESLASVLRVLGTEVERFIMFDFEHDRIIPAERVHQEAINLGYPSSCSRTIDIETGPEDIIVVCGSFYMMKEVCNQIPRELF